MTDFDGDWGEFLGRKLKERKHQGLLRKRKTACPLSASTVVFDGRELINFGSNDYLALSWHPMIKKSVKEAIDLWPVGSGASPLIMGRGPWTDELEMAIADFESTEAAIVFGSGFAANAGTLSALVQNGDLIFSDALNHASLIDGCRLSRGVIHVYRHVDMLDLTNKIRKHRHQGKNAFIVTDSVFSMEGDTAPLDAIIDIAKMFDAQVVIDEAHATGILGQHGSGLAEYLNVEQSIDVRIGTLSKAIGSVGGFVCGNDTLIEYLVNHARSYIYSTAMSPYSAIAARDAIKLIPKLTAERTDLQQKSKTMRQRLIDAGWNVPKGETPIIPIYVGTSEKSAALSQYLFNKGLFVPSIRPPTIPIDQSLIRISINTSHTVEHLELLVRCLERSKIEIE